MHTTPAHKAPHHLLGFLWWDPTPGFKKTGCENFRAQRKFGYVSGSDSQ